MKPLPLLLIFVVVCGYVWAEEEILLLDDYSAEYWRGWQAGREWAFNVAKEAGWKPKSILKGRTRLDGGKGKNIDEIYYEIKCLESNNKGEVEQMILKNASISKFKVTKTGSKQISSENDVDIKIKIYK